MWLNFEFLNRFWWNYYHKITYLIFSDIEIIDTVDLSNTLNHIEVTSYFSEYLQNQTCFTISPLQLHSTFLIIKRHCRTFTLRNTYKTPNMLIVLIFRIYGFLCCVFCFVYLCPVLPVSLDCQFLIVPSVFSNVYILLVLTDLDMS
jgi:hypothetical protein